jgi:hypothetical protein
MLSHLREAGAPLVLVVVSVLSAVATIVKAEYWVGIAAAVAAVLSGGVVLRAQVLVPARTRAATSACAHVIVDRPEYTTPLAGSATQVAPGIWVTAAHVVNNPAYGADNSTRTIHLHLRSGVAKARLVWSDTDADMAVLQCDVPHPWTAPVSRKATFDEGDRVRLVAWARQNRARDAVRISQEYVVQAITDNGSALLAGPPAFAGMSGGPAVHLATGKVIGVAVHAVVPEEHSGVLYGARGVLVATFALIPADRLSERVDRGSRVSGISPSK